MPPSESLYPARSTDPRAAVDVEERGRGEARRLAGQVEHGRRHRLLARQADRY